MGAAHEVLLQEGAQETSAQALYREHAILLAAETPAETWVHLSCTKCGCEVKIKPADEDDRRMLHRVPFDFIETFNREGGPACPMCTHWRGGTYWLVRVPIEGEREALKAFVDAYIAAEEAVEPPSEEPVESFSRQEDGSYLERDLTEDEEASLAAHDAAWEAFDGLHDRKHQMKVAAEAFGYTSSELYELVEIEQQTRTTASVPQ